MTQATGTDAETMQAGDAEIKLGAARIALLPERAALLIDHQALLIADTHWGKSQAMRARGMPIPRGVTDEQLRRLEAAIARTAARRVIVLGDLFDAPSGTPETLLDTLAKWITRARHELEVCIELVPGNHDRRLGANKLSAVLDRIGVSLLDHEITLGGLALRHDPEEHGTAPAIGGHLHPAVTLDPGQHPLRVPAFHVLGRERLVLPAFSTFTAGGGLGTLRPGDRVFIAAEGRVVELTDRL